MATTDYEAIGSALHSALGGTAGTVYYNLAPQGTPTPYIVFQRMNGADEYTFNDAGISTDYLIKAVSSDYWPDEAEAMYAVAHGSAQDAALSVTGYRTLRCRRMTTLSYQDNDRYWHVGGVYRVDIWGTA